MKKVLNLVLLSVFIMIGFEVSARQASEKEIRDHLQLNVRILSSSLRMYGVSNYNAEYDKKVKHKASMSLIEFNKQYFDSYSPGDFAKFFISENDEKGHVGLVKFLYRANNYNSRVEIIHILNNSESMLDALSKFDNILTRDYSAAWDDEVSYTGTNKDFIK